MKEKISEIYIKQFDVKCGACLRRADGGCAYSGAQVADIKFKVDRYFGLCVPGPVDVSCPVFVELKRGFDEELRQVPAKLALEQARRRTGPRTFTGKAEGG